ncbi:MAG: alpha/beta fold hydrolase [Phycisphaerales bacterium]|nr:alpha/beta fold hydrolase [Phycisphaerales bacterium]|tara:strand:- start:3186 stop:3992 length:807 start_codon:yes stop_codon:yes gene_type:complete
MSANFDQLPSALKKQSTLEKLGPTGVPSLLVRPESPSDSPPPLVIWMHGRTAFKELDPGRYLRFMRAGIATCAIDLPGHGERSDETLQTSEHVLDVVVQMVEELDEVVKEATAALASDPDRIGIGGMSAGGMVALARLTRPHRFVAASIEATSGNWSFQSRLPMLESNRADLLHEWDPIRHLQGWREIPIQAFHCKADEWVPFDGQDAFIKSLRNRYENPELIDWMTYDQTGTLHEHVGFGPHSADVKERQRSFFQSSFGITPETIEP